MANYINGNGGFNSSRYNAQDVPAINTNSIPMYNGDKCLKLSFMNDSIVIRIIPAVIGEDGSRRYPKDSGTWCVIKLDYVVLIRNWIHQYFIPHATEIMEKLKKDPTYEFEPVMIGIPTNKDNTNMIALKFEKPVDGALAPKLYVYTGIDENRIPSASEEYEFGLKRIFTKYESDTGNFECTMDNVQFWIFLEVIENFIDASTMAEVHADKLGNSFVNREMRNLIRQLAQANGIATYSYDQNKGNTGYTEKPTPKFDNNASQSVATLEDMMGIPGSPNDPLPF